MNAAAATLLADIRRLLGTLGAWLAPQRLTIAVAATLGLMAIELPAHVRGPLPPVRSPLFQWLGQGWQYCNCRASWTLLFAIGLLLGLIWPRRWFVAGVSTMLVFPIAATIEMLFDPYSHTLWPIEFALYFVFSLCAVVGALLTRLLLLLISRVRRASISAT